ncbi:MAG: SdiA-regulated domain-containing protein, partial [Pseudomonadota bacterium]|nr:SdiA-regulated domain-containing protein [Pseudomonadota bacterium]
MNFIYDKLSNHTRTVRFGFLALLAYLGAQQLMYELEIDDHLHALWNEISTDEAIKNKSIWLPNYQLSHQAALPFVNNNLSGITYNPETNRLWVIVNSPQRLIELDTDFNPT